MLKWFPLMLVVGVLSFVQPLAAASDEEAVVKTLQSMFDKPEARLEVSPTVVVGDYAVAGWSQGQMGGRALLKRAHNQWTIVLCAGDQIRSAEALHRAGLAKGDAEQMADRIAKAESGVSTTRLALFAKFDGIVMMDSGGHPKH